MREVKFRAFDKSRDDMFTRDFFVDISGRAYEIIDSSYCGHDVIKFNDDLVLMQFTEIRDCDGIEIYFGDIVKIYGYGNLHVDSLGDLMILVDALAENDIGEILGNIYENKDLIEANKWNN